MGKAGVAKALVDSFDLTPGRKIAGKYEVLSLLGAGWEGEVYKIREIHTGIERAAKRQTENSCVCDARHASKSKDFFGISNHYIKCGVTAVCVNK